MVFSLETHFLKRYKMQLRNEKYVFITSFKNVECDLKLSLYYLECDQYLNATWISRIECFDFLYPDF